MEQALRLYDDYPDEPIYLYINSHGGILDYAFDLGDLLRALPCRVIGVVNGDCQSSAFTLLQFCDERLATPHSRLLIHGISETVEMGTSYSNSTQLVHIRRGQKQYYDLMINLFVSRTGLDRKKVEKLCREGDRDRTLMPQEALELNMIDKIITKFPFFPEYAPE